MRRTHLAGIVLVGTLTAPVLVAHSQSPKPPSGEKYALLVGVRQYDPNELRSLPYPEADVVELAQLLKGDGYRQVVTLTQTTGATNFRLLPTGANIRTTLKGLLEDRDPGDTVLVAFAGHGVQFSGSTENYFCPMDARLADRATLISLGEVYKDLESCGAGVRVLLVDACRNDPQSDNSRGRSSLRLESVTRPQQARPPGGVAALFSCSAGEKSFEHERLKHGVFYHFVIQGLKGGADLDKDGTIDVEELARFTKRNVPDFVKEEYGFDVRQMPVLRGEIGGLAALVGSTSARGPDGTMARTSGAGGAATEMASRSHERLSPSPSPPVGPKELTSSTGMRLVLIPSGEFLMGSTSSDTGALDYEKPAHRVRITRPFYLGATEVTQGEYRQVMGDNPSWFSASGEGKGMVAGEDTDQYPVENVSWNDAIAFCNKLSERDGLRPYYRFGAGEQSGGDGYRLPTEAEWEYACRAGSRATYAHGDGAASLGEYAWIRDNSGDKTNPVGRKRANAFGLYDMHGNVYEWCWDGYDEGFYTTLSASDPSGPSQASVRVRRGGGWHDFPQAARSACRSGHAPDRRDSGLGFRVARVRSGR